MTARPRSSSGDSESTYAPSLDVGNGGTVKVNSRTQEAGEEVTLTVTPDEGYEAEQVSVTGFDDCIYAELLHPPLTTVRQNVPAKAEAAVELLVRLIRQEPVECKNYVQPVELIRRNSVRESTPNAAPWSQDLHKTHK